MAAPVVPGLTGKHGLSETQKGRLLFSELRCASCHATETVKQKKGPDLSLVGSRLNPDFIQRFIASPQSVDPGTQMPDLLEGNPERNEIAEALTHYLISRTGNSFIEGVVKQEEVDPGKKLFEKIGCINCHLPGKGVQLSHVSSKYGVDSLSEFLFQPLHARPSGRMPDMNLTREEAKSIASYLIGFKAVKLSDFKPVAAKVAAGKKYFGQLNCVSCHELDGLKGSPSLTQEKLRLGRGCLSAKPSLVPHFHLSQKQREAINQALPALGDPLGDKEQIHQSLAAFNCIVCHTRDGAGGVSNVMFQYFGTDEDGLGNPARIPPTLDGVGAKLKPEWLRKVLFDAETVRPYMHTRMPQFGETNLGHLPGLFEKVDQLPKVELTEPKRNDRRKYRDGGHLLLGDKGLNCIACHNFNGKASPGLKGVDLLNSFERLQPSWFVHFMKNPQKYRPGIVMPNYWPGGEAVRKDVLEGDTDEQMRALWYYFSLGRSARDPSGIRSVGTDLKVADRVRVYRGRSRIAGYRGIAVGFPGGMSYAFNAEYGSLSGLWKGDFVSVGWGGQGAGNFNPKGRPIELAQDVAFYRLAKEDDSWPLRPRMDKENPVNPDPLYPRNRGYQFKGYRLDKNGVPTFIYQTGEVEVEDTSVSGVADAIRDGLVRKIQFTVPKSEILYFRALTGRLQQRSATEFTSDAVKLQVPEGAALLRGEGEARELLLKLKLPKGKSTIKIRYELLR
ncbi:c-type cytochrome [Verrucomicrobia bacterium]|nr:c-type cytochrome [Verrucomicrobiota bacterium]